MWFNPNLSCDSLSNFEVFPIFPLARVGRTSPDAGAVENRASFRIKLMSFLQESNQPDSRVWVYDTEIDKVFGFDFSSGKNDDQDEFTNDAGPKSDMEE